MSLKMKNTSFSIAKIIGRSVNYFFKNYIWETLFFNLSFSEQFVFLMRCSDPQIMAWFGKFIHHSFPNRNILRHDACTRWGQGVVFLWLFRHWRQRLMTCGDVSEIGAVVSWRSFDCSRMYVFMKFNHFHSRKWIWECRLRDGVLFRLGLRVLNAYWLNIMWIIILSS